MYIRSRSNVPGPDRVLSQPAGRPRLIGLRGALKSGLSVLTSGGKSPARRRLLRKKRVDSTPGFSGICLGLIISDFLCGQAGGLLSREVGFKTETEPRLFAGEKRSILIVYWFLFSFACFLYVLLFLFMSRSVFFVSLLFHTLYS